MKLACSLLLCDDNYLLAFEDAFMAGLTLASEFIVTEEILFRGSYLELMKVSESFASKIQEGKWQDYYYSSWGFPSAHRSLQSAIWKIEDRCESPNVFNYFIVMKREAILAIAKA